MKNPFADFVCKRIEKNNSAFKTYSAIAFKAVTVKRRPVAAVGWNGSQY